MSLLADFTARYSASEAWFYDRFIASIKHWPDQAKGLAECVRVLRAGGQLLIVEADRGCHLEDARTFVSRWRLPNNAL